MSADGSLEKIDHREADRRRQARDAPHPGGVRALWKNLGPGIVTGAADDDPSGIATYSIAGAHANTRSASTREHRDATPRADIVALAGNGCQEPRVYSQEWGRCRRPGRGGCPVIPRERSECRDLPSLRCGWLS